MKTRNAKVPDISNIPSGANKEKILEKAELLNKLSIFNNTPSSLQYVPIETLEYLGGCSNHAIRAKIQGKDSQREFLIRLPGSQSELMIDRASEKYNTDIVADLELCPRILESYDRGELNGFKVEEFLQGKSLNFDNFKTFQDKALAALKKVHDCGKIFKTEYNIFDRIIMMCETLKANGIKFLAYNKREKQVSLDRIIEVIESLKKKAADLFGQPNLVPCHNDISPFNFMLVSDQEKKNEIQIIDWEYSGMNDRMVDLAYIASENGYTSRTEVEKLLTSYFNKTPEKEDIDKVLFYIPLIDLKVSVWALMQVHMRNESKEIEGLRKGWGPERFAKFIERTQSPDFQAVVAQLDTEFLLKPKE